MDSSVLITSGAILLGTLVGAGATFGTLFWIEKRKEGKIKEGFIKLLLCDIDSLWKRYMELIGEEIKNHDEEKIFYNYLRVKHNWFSVFDNNSDKILYLDDETSRLVVQFYNRAKAHIDNICAYGEEAEDYRNMPKDTLDSRPRVAGGHLRELFKPIKNESIELEKMALTTISALKR